MAFKSKPGKGAHTSDLACWAVSALALETADIAKIYVVDWCCKRFIGKPSFNGAPKMSKCRCGQGRR
jgi:hypothetical protein